MAKKATLESQEKRVKEWRRAGSGSRENYKPWLTVRSFSSHGKSSRVKGYTSGRVHHLFSQNELKAFCALDWLESVVDIREQYPLLPLEETIQIADEIGVKHPTHPQGKFPVVMTTDFLLDIRGQVLNQEACSVKSALDLENKRNLEKLEIERIFYTRRSTNFCIISERELDNQVVENILWFRGAEVPQSVTSAELSSLLDELFIRLLSLSGPLGSNCRGIDRALGLELGTSLALVRYALRAKHWFSNLSVPLHEDQPLPPLRRRGYSL